MTSLLDVRPPDQEPLPLYSQQDPDSASVRSAAPSYVSDTPSYESYRAPTSLLPPPLPGQHSVGLPPARGYAPGFAPELRNRASGRTAEFSFGERGVGSRVVRGKMRGGGSASGSASASASRRDAQSVPVSPLSPLSPASIAGSESGNLTRSEVNSPVRGVAPGPVEGFSPSGEEAGRERREREREAFREESRGWEFMVGQMGEWKERRSSWNVFREGLPRRAKRRFGIRG